MERMNHTQFMFTLRNGKNKMVKIERTWELITFITFALQLQEGTFLVALVYLKMGEETKISNTTTGGEKKKVVEGTIDHRAHNRISACTATSGI
jgi:hypothetical protein